MVATVFSVFRSNSVTEAPLPLLMKPRPRSGASAMPDTGGIRDGADLLVLIDSDHQHAIAVADKQAPMRRVEAEVVPAARAAQRQGRQQARCSGRRGGVAGHGDGQQQQRGWQEGTEQFFHGSYLEGRAGKISLAVQVRLNVDSPPACRDDAAARTAPASPAAPAATAATCRR